MGEWEGFDMRWGPSFKSCDWLCDICNGLYYMGSGLYNSGILCIRNRARGNLDLGLL